MGFEATWLIGCLNDLHGLQMSIVRLQKENPDIFVESDHETVMLVREAEFYLVEARGLMVGLGMAGDNAEPIIAAALDRINRGKECLSKATKTMDAADNRLSS